MVVFSSFLNSGYTLLTDRGFICVLILITASFEAKLMFSYGLRHAKLYLSLKEHVHHDGSVVFTHHCFCLSPPCYGADVLPYPYCSTTLSSAHNLGHFPAWLCYHYKFFSSELPWPLCHFYFHINFRFCLSISPKRPTEYNLELVLSMH